jgi:hypothetical protein
MKKYMLNTIFAVAIVLVLRCPTLSQIPSSESTARVTSVRAETRVEGWPASDNLLNSLLRSGANNKLPLGIVVEGEALCVNRVKSIDADITVGSLANQIEQQVPDYAAEIRNGTLFVHPKAMSAGTISVLNLVIPRFSGEPSSAQSMGVTLWMYIRAILVPNEGSAFEGGLQRGAETLPAFRMTNSTVQEILNRTVTAGQGGFWIMHKVPANWQSNPNSLPYQVLSYSGDDPEGTRLVGCSE